MGEKGERVWDHGRLKEEKEHMYEETPRSAKLQ